MLAMVSCSNTLPGSKVTTASSTVNLIQVATPCHISWFVGLNSHLGVALDILIPDGMSKPYPLSSSDSMGSLLTQRSHLPKFSPAPLYPCFPEVIAIRL